MDLTREGWEPDPSAPANMEGHWGPFGQTDPHRVLQHVNLPERLISALEAHREEWKVSIRGHYCKNCHRGFLLVDVFKPVNSIFMAYTFETYSFQADK